MWKSVVGFEGYYEVSDDGRVRRVVGRQCWAERILKHAIDKKGYARVKLCVSPRITTQSVHKIVAEAFIGPMSPASTINHKDCDKLNNRASNLEYCSRRENTQHAVRNGIVSLSGAKLTADQVLDIKRRYRSRTNSSAVLSEEYGITRRSICRIATGEAWGHLNRTRRPRNP